MEERGGVPNISFYEHVIAITLTYYNSSPHIESFFAETLQNTFRLLDISTKV